MTTPPLGEKFGKTDESDCIKCNTVGAAQKQSLSVQIILTLINMTYA